MPDARDSPAANAKAPVVPFEFEVSSVLPVAANVVWAQIATMRGVNAELMPFVRMTYPPELEQHGISAAPLGRVAFRSWLLLFGVLPFDLHSLRLLRVDSGRGFLESSTSWLQRHWVHERTLEDAAGGCRITDRVGFEPRLPFVGPLLLPILRAVFAHRHRRLQRVFGSS